MRQLITRLKNFRGAMLWDFITAIVLFLFMIWNLDRFEGNVTRLSLIILTTGFLVLMVAVKYHLLYKHFGRDDVTGGKDKKEFERVAGKMLRSDAGYVLVYANIDRFKLINEIYGNSVGDQILHQIHGIIDAELGWDEVSGRIMADNFGILMHFHSLPKLDERLARISKQMEELVDENGNRYGIALYYGVYVINDKDIEVSTMLEHANLARRKISPGYRVPMGIYDEKDKFRLGREKELEMKMHESLERGDFIPYLQPKYELEGETVAGAEALVRWVDSEEGMIFPNEFIPLFESNGFVVDIDLYMFEQVCRMVERWGRAGWRTIPVSVNLSRSHFNVPNFFDAYEAILEQYEIPPRSIEIELTESLFYNDMEALNTLVTKIHRAGLSCSIDDFGSGFSSLNVLKEVQVDALKLDRVFFVNDNSQENERGKSVIQSVIQLAQALDLHTISEGVEERDQVESLKQMKCDLIQGYVFAKPMPVTEFEKLAFGGVH